MTDVLKHIPGAKLIATLPGPGPWTLAAYGKMLVAVSPYHVPMVITREGAELVELGATLGASAQNGRGNRPTVDDIGLQCGSETEAPSGKRL